MPYLLIFVSKNPAEHSWKIHAEGLFREEIRNFGGYS